MENFSTDREVEFPHKRPIIGLWALPSTSTRGTCLSQDLLQFHRALFFSLLVSRMSKTKKTKSLIMCTDIHIHKLPTNDVTHF
jgi:hypothetical protein